MTHAKKQRFELPTSEFARLPSALRERWVGMVADAGAIPDQIEIGIPYHLAPRPAQEEIYEESSDDGRFVELRPEQALPVPLVQLHRLLKEMNTPLQPSGPRCKVTRFSEDSDRPIEVVLIWL